MLQPCYSACMPHPLSVPLPALPQTRDEVRVLRSLAHPNVIQYHDCFADGGVQYIAMEYAEVRLIVGCYSTNRNRPVAWLLQFFKQRYFISLSKQKGDKCGETTQLRVCLTEMLFSKRMLPPSLCVPAPHPCRRGTWRRCSRRGAASCFPRVS